MMNINKININIQNYIKINEWMVSRKRKNMNVDRIYLLLKVCQYIQN